MSPMPVGMSRASITLRRTSGSASVPWSITMSVWSESTCSATSWAYGVSGVERSASGRKFSVWPMKSTAKVRTRSPFSASTAADSAVMVLESRPAGEQHAARHVGDELAADDVVEQRAHARDARVPVVVVRMRGEPPVAALAHAAAR